MLYVVGGDVLDAPYGHKVIFISKRTVGDACPYKLDIDIIKFGGAPITNTDTPPIIF